MATNLFGEIPIVFVRYAPGACGTFLLTVLSSSTQFACWCPELQKIKGTSAFADMFFSWFQTKFTTNLGEHLLHEPHHPYRLDFWSSKYPRGDTIDSNAMIAYLTLRDDQHFLDNIKQRRPTPLRLNKGVVPKFGMQNPVINVVIDPASQRWLNRIRYIKLFEKTQDGFVMKEQHPRYLQAKNLTQRFQNAYMVKTSSYSFIKNHIINEPIVSVMKDRELMIEHESNRYNTHHFINLSCLLDPKTAVDCISELAVMLRADLDHALLTKCCHHYWKTNVQPLSRP